MKRNVLGYGIGVLALSVMLACNHEDVASGFPSAGQQAVLVAQKSHIITRIYNPIHVNGLTIRTNQLQM